VGSGQGYASYVDTDVCFDKNGVPFIPARRLKGVLRDAAEYIGVDNATIDLLFGKIANESPGALTVCNASLNVDLPQNDPPHLVLNKYTRVLSNTRLDNGIADIGSLRMIRVVNRYSSDREEQKLTADCFIDYTLEKEKHKKLEELMNEICLAVRNIGMKRSRGLGAVRLEFEREGKKPIKKKDAVANTLEQANATVNKIELEYTITAKAPLMLPNQRNDDSETFISGTLIQGAILSKLPKEGFDEAVHKWFLGPDAICVSNAYIDCGVPSPNFFVELKPSGKLTTTFNILPDELKDEQKKKLKGEYIVYTDAANRVKTKTETRYHHRREKEDMKEQLYPQNAISERQSFVGKISCNASNVDKLYEIAKLLNGDIWIGRSKTAEYGRCEIEVKKAREDVFSENISLTTGESVFFVFESDALLMNKAGIYSTRREDIISAFNLDSRYSYADASLDVTVRGGYNGVWNLKRPSVPCVKAGSYIEFMYNGEDESKQRCFSVGERLSEGFGRVKLYKKTEIRFGTQEKEAAELIISNDEENRQKIIRFAKDNYDIARKLTSSFIGRVLLMISRAKSYKDFCCMLDSVKDEKKKNTVKSLITDKKLTADCGILTDDNYKETLKLIFTLFRYRNREG